MTSRKASGCAILLCLLISACQTQQNEFFISNPEDSKILRVASSRVNVLKHNVYTYGDILYLAGEYPVERALGDVAVSERRKLYLHKKIDNIPIEDLIDLETYEEIKPLFLYKDKKHVYFFRLEGGCYLCADVLDLNPATLNVFDTNFEYLTDGETTYCLRDGKKMSVTSKLHLIKIRNLSFAIDSDFIYSMCEPIRPEKFLTSFDALSINERESIVKQFLEGKP